MARIVGQRAAQVVGHPGDQLAPRRRPGPLAWRDSSRRAETSGQLAGRAGRARREWRGAAIGADGSPSPKLAGQLA